MKTLIFASATATLALLAPSAMAAGDVETKNEPPTFEILADVDAVPMSPVEMADTEGAGTKLFVGGLSWDTTDAMALALLGANLQSEGRCCTVYPAGEQMTINLEKITVIYTPN